jgi:hypothetical protein
MSKFCLLDLCDLQVDMLGASNDLINKNEQLNYFFNLLKAHKFRKSLFYKYVIIKIFGVYLCQKN